MLSGIAQENCSKVSERIERNFKKNPEAENCSINYYVASVAEICEDIM